MEEGDTIYFYMGYWLRRRYRNAKSKVRQSAVNMFELVLKNNASARSFKKSQEHGKKRMAVAYLLRAFIAHDRLAD